MPRVSIGIPVFNGENYISQCIKSILSQTYTDFELIICDNASSDETENICKEFAAKDARIKYFRNARNLGASQNYNLCFEKSNSEYFKWMAHDDWLSPNYLEKCVWVLDAHDDVVLAFGMPQEMLDERTLYLESDFAIEFWASKGPVERFARSVRLKRLDYAIFGVFRSSAISESTLHRPYYGSDLALVSELSLFGRFIPIAEATFYNRCHRERSVEIVDKLARMRWQDTSNAKKYSTEHLSMLKHLIEITGRHPSKASRHRLLVAMLTRVLNPQQLMRYMAEIIAMVIPDTYWKLRDLLLDVMRSSKVRYRDVHKTNKN